MTRTLHNDMVTAAQAVTGEIFHLYDLAFSGGTLYLTTAPNDVTWSGNTYTATKVLHDPVPESTELGAQSVRLTLDGVDTSIITRIRQQNYIGQTAIIRSGHIASDGTIVTNPVIVFQGQMNAPFEARETFGREGGGSSVTTRITSPFALINKRNGIRANVASHSAVFSGDTFWRHVANIGVTGVKWGNATPVTIGGATFGGGGGGREGDVLL